VQANGVFVDLPAPVVARLRERGWRFYTFIGDTGVRLMCSWDTPAEAVDRLVDDLRTALATDPAAMR
jgi:threonine aldolase